MLHTAKILPRHVVSETIGRRAAPTEILALIIALIGRSVGVSNNAAISIAHGKEQSKRSKHYQVKVHFLNQSFQTGVFAYEKVPTKEMLADAFTKSLPRDDFCRYRSWMGMRDQPVIENT